MTAIFHVINLTGNYIKIIQNERIKGGREDEDQ
jgi:hypothetical protein